MIQYTLNTFKVMNEIRLMLYAMATYNCIERFPNIRNIANIVNFRRTPTRIHSQLFRTIAQLSLIEHVQIFDVFTSGDRRAKGTNFENIVKCIDIICESRSGPARMALPPLNNAITKKMILSRFRRKLTEIRIFAGIKCRIKRKRNIGFHKRVLIACLSII